MIKVKAIEGDIKTRFIAFQFISNNNFVNLEGCTVRIYAVNNNNNEIFND